MTPLYGKLGDLLGRKRVLQAAIIVFLIGSVLCGLAQSMPELIAFRAIQGLGGGGLMVGAQAALGEWCRRVSAAATRPVHRDLRRRERHRPAARRLHHDHLSWQWIFYINLPLGFVAFAVLAATFPSVGPPRPGLDVAGSRAAGGGPHRGRAGHDPRRHHPDWTSPPSSAWPSRGGREPVAFFLVERRAAEPILPPRLWRSATFRITRRGGPGRRLRLFGAVTFLPLFQQVVRGESPTASGLQLLPLMAGVMVSSVASGRMIAATGHYRVYPILGTGLTVVGMLLLSTMGPGTGVATSAAFMAVLGCGLGMVMQVLILAVQNDAPYEDLGVATAGATLFRSIGGSLGTAVLGAVFTNRLAVELADRLPAGAGAVVRSGNVNPAAVGALPDPVRSAYLDGFSAAFTTVFLAAAGVAAVAFALTWLIREVPLRTTVRGGPEDAPAPERVREEAQASPVPH